MPFASVTEYRLCEPVKCVLKKQKQNFIIWVLWIWIQFNGRLVVIGMRKLFYYFWLIKFEKCKREKNNYKIIGCIHIALGLIWIYCGGI